MEQSKTALTAHVCACGGALQCFPRRDPQPPRSIPSAPVHIQKILKLKGRIRGGGVRGKHGAPFLCPMLRLCPLGGDSTQRTALRRLAKPGMAKHHGGGELLEGLSGVLSRRADLLHGRQEREESKQLGTPVRRNSGSSSGGAARHTDSKQRGRKRHRRNDWRAHSLAKATQTKSLRALAASERTDNDTDNIYIYIYIYAYMSPLC